MSFLAHHHGNNRLLSAPIMSMFAIENVHVLLTQTVPHFLVSCSGTSCA